MPEMIKVIMSVPSVDQPSSSAIDFRYARGQRPFDPRWRFLSGFRSPRRLLDIGCGWGQTGRHLRELYPGAEIHGIDLDETGPDWLIYERCNLDRDDLPYPDGQFDGVFMNHVLEHLRDPVRVGRELGRVLAPGGVIYVEAPNWISTVVPSPSFLWGQKMAPMNFWDDSTHIRPWSKHGLYSWLTSNCNLEVVAHGVRRNWPWVPLDLIASPICLMVGRVRYGQNALKNVLGWSVFGIGRRPRPT